MRTPLRERLSWTDNALTLVLVSAVFLLQVVAAPRALIKDVKYSTVLLDAKGELLGARIAADGQWRFPPSGKVPEKYAIALTEFEDRCFWAHPGVNPAAMVRAAFQNLRAGHIVSGGSTITMQLIRLSDPGPRTIGRKCTETLKAVQLERFATKEQILSLYAANAPFGGNVVGIDAASWRYFGHDADELSWAEAALLAVLPNAPSQLHVSRNREKLLAKRNNLLFRLFEQGKLDGTDFELACSEALPDEPLPLPQYAPHLLERYCKGDEGGMVYTDIDLSLQRRVLALTDRWNRQLAQNGINDLAAIVVDVHNCKILAYVGNANAADARAGAQVDIVRAPRSSGSILKPFLYCAMLQDGALLPHSLLPDLPVNINGFSPQNFDRQFDGAVPASEALARSLNVPAVQMLRSYGVPRFHELLRAAGLSTLTRSPSVYGLSLILGGAEVTLEDVTRAYAALAARYQDCSWVPDTFPFNDACALWWTFDALKEVNRPDQMDWRMISSVPRIAWKTGTSFGFRDAWAVGVTRDYAVGVWAGNAQGQGSPGLVGARTAGPVLFDLFNLLPASDWFADPEDFIEAELCPESGMLASVDCPERELFRLPANALRSEACPYHRKVTLSSDGKWRTDPADPDGVIATMFLLPPSMEWYYRSRHSAYRPLPPLKPGSKLGDGYLPMEFIYPEPGSRISIPRQLDGSLQGIVFNLAHSDPDTELFWHLDDGYVGSTRFLHQMRLLPDPGDHTVTVVDADGNSLSINFTIEKGDR